MINLGGERGGGGEGGFLGLHETHWLFRLYLVLRNTGDRLNRPLSCMAKELRKLLLWPTSFNVTYQKFWSKTGWLTCRVSSSHWNNRKWAWLLKFSCTFFLAIFITDPPAPPPPFFEESPVLATAYINHISPMAFSLKLHYLCIMKLCD